MRVMSVYKCQLCGQLLRYGNTAEMEHEKMPEVVGKFISRYQTFAGSALSPAPMYIPHKCGNGNCGMAIFAGLMPER